jgi:DnaK suppressor protein
MNAGKEREIQGGNLVVSIAVSNFLRHSIVHTKALDVDQPLPRRENITLNQYQSKALQQGDSERSSSMPPLSPADLATFREALLARRTQLSAEISDKLTDARSERIGTDAVTSTDGGDRASISTAGELDIAQARRDADELQAIERAEERLAAGTFGQCADCSEDIPVARLRAYPAAVRCNLCQQTFEKKHPEFSARM